MLQGQYYQQMEVILVYNLLDYDLVEVKETDKIKIDMQYPKLGMKNAIDKCYLKKDVYERLKEASIYLPDGYSFKVLDAYRPFKLQEELYNKYYKLIEKKFHIENLNKEYKDNFISKFVAIPDRDNPPAHTTGGAIDITLLKDGKDVDMGSSFDEFCEKTYTNYFKDKNSNIHKNRIILYECMTKAGFTNIETEYWHYDYGNKSWADITGNDILYNKVVKYINASE